MVSVSPEDAVSYIERQLSAVRRRTRSSGYRRSLLRPGEHLKHYGVGNIRHWNRWFRSPLLFRENLATRPPRVVREPRYLVGQNFLDEEFVLFDGPKVFSTKEPPFAMTDETNSLLADGGLDDFLYLYGDPDPGRRMYYPCLPMDRAALLASLTGLLHRQRPLLACIVARWAEHDAASSLSDERIAAVEAFGEQLDIYGNHPHRGANGWERYGTYQGPTPDKLGTLRSYTFTVAFENSDIPGYTTEKLFDAMRAGCIPLYLGGGGWIQEVVPESAYVECRGRTAEEIRDLALGMCFDEILDRRRAAIEFLGSSEADRFTYEHWASETTKRLSAQVLDSLPLRRTTAQLSG